MILTAFGFTAVDNQLAYDDDDGGGGLGSALTFTAPESGAYLVSVLGYGNEDHNGANRGCYGTCTHGTIFFSDNYDDSSDCKAIGGDACVFGCVGSAWRWLQSVVAAASR